MSQAGDIDVLGNNPNIPTTFVTDDGDAVPIANTLEILGTYVLAGTTPVETTGSGNTVTIEVQTAQAIAATDVTKIGLANFNSAQFTVDANGFVSLAGAGIAIDSIGTQTGTNPIVPTVAGLVTLNGAVVAAGTNPVRSNGTGANTMAMQIQISQAIAATDATKIGLSNFNSAQFTVDANGFVSTNGAAVPNTITGNSGGALSPTAGNWNIFGASTAAGTSPVTTSGAVSTLTVNVQKAQAIAATDATKVGLANFDSSAFSVDANGFVTLKGGGLAIDSISPNSGTDPIVPDANGNVSILGTGSITTVGSLNTETIQLTGLTQYAVLVGAGTATITKVGPTATAGQVLQSAGSSADPAFSTATYPSTTTANRILYSSATNVVGQITNTIRSVMICTSGGVPAWEPLNANGQLIIGSASTQPAAATLTAGLGISITNAANSITIAGTGAGFPWLDNSGSFTAVANTGYFLTAASTPTLPVAPAQGTVVEFAVVATATMTITAGTGGFIVLDGATSVSGGTAVSGTIGNTIKLVYRTSGTTWWATSAVGASWTIT